MLLAVILAAATPPPDCFLAPDLERTIAGCRSIPNPDQRLRCFDNIPTPRFEIARPPTPAREMDGPVGMGAWRTLTNEDKFTDARSWSVLVDGSGARETPKLWLSCGPGERAPQLWVTAGDAIAATSEGLTMVAIRIDHDEPFQATWARADDRDRDIVVYPHREKGKGDLPSTPALAERLASAKRVLFKARALLGGFVDLEFDVTGAAGALAWLKGKCAPE